MARAYYSIVVDRSADEVWAAIRLFDHYAWAGVMSETIIEGGKAGDQVGAVRRVVVGDTATIRIVPIVESGQAFVEWWATFDCAAEERDRWVHYFEREGFARWLATLRQFMTQVACLSP